jgi:uncharacterized iron-regulated membrane protein
VTSLLRRVHVWLGLVTAIGVVTVSITGVLLNHRESLGLWSPPRGDGGNGLAGALPINELLERGLRAARDSGIDLHGQGLRNINRMLYRPGRGTASVRLTDPRTTEIVLDGATGRVLQVAPRDDVSIEHVHSGEVIGQRGVILSDVVAVVVVVLTISGIALWLQRLRLRRPPAGAARRSRWLRLNLAVHLIAGLAVAVLVVVLSVTGVLLNHKRELGLMVEPTSFMEAEQAVKEVPARLHEIAEWARNAAPERFAAMDIRWIDYRPLAGYAKVRFDSSHELEVIVDAYEPRVLSVALRYDVLVERIHSGAVLGARATLLSDAAALLLIVLVANGLYVWLAPAARSRTRMVAAAVERADAREADRVEVGVE